MLERLQKILSARGIASRRKAEEYIEAGLVKVNGIVAKIGDKADPEKDSIEVDGKVTEERQEMLYFLMNKPTGVVTSNVARWSAKKRGSAAVPQSLKDETVRDLIPQKFRDVVYPVGRLDKDSSGLLLLTNDGPLAYRLTHPKFEHEKEYEVETRGNITDDALEKMSAGRMSIDGALIKPVFIKRIGPFRFRITLTEGKNRQIRRMCEKVGFPVVTLKRVRIMMLEDTALKAGAMRELTDKERTALLHTTGLQ
jgi:23S rRNA pseudouridine2605 synthase